MKAVSPQFGQMKNGVHDDCSKNFLHSSELPMNGGFTALYPNEFGIALKKGTMFTAYFRTRCVLSMWMRVSISHLTR
jgi:hypothetical protein